MDMNKITEFNLFEFFLKASKTSYFVNRIEGLVCLNECSVMK